MSAYYYLVAGLPDLSLEDGKLNYTLSSFKTELYPDLSEKDKSLVDLLYLKFDNRNLLRLLKDKDAETEGKDNYSSDELLALIAAVRDGEAPDSKYPIYFYEFISQYLTLSPEETYRSEDMLASAYYMYARRCKNRFLASWFDFNLNVNNILAALTARKYKMDVADVVVGQTEICDALRTSNARDFGLNEVIDYFEALLHISETEELVEREKKVDQLKWNWLESESFFHYFTIERILVFVLRLEMIERWISLDKEKGHELFRQMIQHLKDEVQIPEEFRK